MEHELVPVKLPVRAVPILTWQTKMARRPPEIRLSTVSGQGLVVYEAAAAETLYNLGPEKVDFPTRLPASALSHLRPQQWRDG